MSRGVARFEISVASSEEEGFIESLRGLVFLVHPFIGIHQPIPDRGVFGIQIHSLFESGSRLGIALLVVEKRTEIGLSGVAGAEFIGSLYRHFRVGSIFGIAAIDVNCAEIGKGLGVIGSQLDDVSKLLDGFGIFSLAVVEEASSS